MTKHRNYFSDRGLPLLFVHRLNNIPVVALENYTKWYSIYLIVPNGGKGEVVKIDPRTIFEVCAKYSDARWVDHLYHPRLLYRLAQHLNATVCERSAEVAAGRWIMESREFEDECDRFKFHDPSLD